MKDEKKKKTVNVKKGQKTKNVLFHNEIFLN